MSGGGIAGLKTTNHRRYTTAATLMREMPTANKLEAEDNQHNTKTVTNKETTLCHKDGRRRRGELQVERYESHEYSVL